MKTLILISILSLISVNFVFSQWMQQSSGTSQRLLTCYFINENIGWAAGDAGTILKTTNSGESWFSQSLNTNFNVHSIHFIDSLKGWAVLYSISGGRNSKIIKTINGGNTWETVRQFSGFVLIDIKFSDAFNGIAVGSDGIILITTDGGNSWADYGPTAFGWSTNIYMKSKNLVWVAGSIYGYLLRTTDMGFRWSFIAFPDEGTINSITFSDAFNGWCCGENGRVFRSTNSGLDWEQVSLNTTNTLNDLYFINGDKGWIVGGNGKIFYTSDSGQSWNNQSNFNDEFYCIQMIDSLKGWIVGTNGKILKTDNGGVIVSVENEVEKVKDFYLFNNYPNPFNPNTIISWQSPISGRQTLKIFDILGNEVATLIDEYREAGRYEVEFNITRFALSDRPELTTGVYFYRLQIGSFIDTRKMIYLK